MEVEKFEIRSWKVQRIAKFERHDAGQPMIFT
jgi:hypothetical protein